MRTTKSLIPVALTVAVFVFAIGSFDHAKAKNSPPIPNVTTTVYDTDLSSNPTSLQSDKEGVYNTTSFATDNIRSQIYGFWYLDLTSQTTRTVYLDLSDNKISGPSTTPIPTGYYNAEVISRCFDASGNILNFLDVVDNARCSLRVNLTLSNGTAYYYVMSPESEFAGTGWATVTCNVESAGVCSNWTITPTPVTVEANANVANLYEVGHGGKLTLIGSYKNTYRINIVL